MLANGRAHCCSLKRRARRRWMGCTFGQANWQGPFETAAQDSIPSTGRWKLQQHPAVYSRVCKVPIQCHPRSDGCVCKQVAMSASRDRAADMNSKHRPTTRRRERKMTVDLAIRDSRHRFLFTINCKHWDEKDTEPFATSSYSVAQISSFPTSAGARLLRDHAHSLYDDIHTHTLFFLRRSKR
jgi:hypothetical protein